MSLSEQHIADLCYSQNMRNSRVCHWVGRGSILTRITESLPANGRVLRKLKERAPSSTVDENLH